MTTGERHRLATRVARAARLADSPIGYYHAYADIGDALQHLAVTPADGIADGGTPYTDEECDRYTTAALERFYQDVYSAEVWKMSAPDPAAAVVEVTA